MADIGLIGLAVMGQNLVLNMNDHGFTVAVFNRTTSKVDEFLKGAAKGTNVVGTHSLEEFVHALKRPRRVILMVKAGEAVDDFIRQLLPHLEKGDVIIDGGNSLFTDSKRRCDMLREKGLLFLGAGISGGEEGARHGPSIMPGGNKEAWPLLKPIFQAIAAKVETGEPCCDWVGEEGAGHYVKMVHNGIEYGDMQLIAEAYHLMKSVLGLDADAISRTFAEWNQGELNSYLIEITSAIFAHKENGAPLVDSILDAAGQKGTGGWTVANALDLGIPATLISESVFARSLSSLKELRLLASEAFPGVTTPFQGDKKLFLEAIRQALYAAKIISYAQGFMLMQQAAKTYNWNLNYGGIALMWRGGCIIRSRFLGKIKEAFSHDPNIQNLLLNDFFRNEINRAEKGFRTVVSQAALTGIPVPCLGSALSFYDGFRTAILPANLIQAQRDFFGAHTYERTDKPRGQFFHTQW